MMRETKSGDGAGGTRVLSLSVLLATERARKSSTVFSKIFVRKNCTGWRVLSRAFAYMQMVILAPGLVAKKRPYNRCARECSGELSSVARSRKIG